MAFLTLNGITISVRDAQPRIVYDRLGFQGRAYSGEIVDHRRKSFRAWDFETTPLLLAEANALVRFIEDQGHSWGFEDATYWEYSDNKGLYRSANDNVSRSTANAWSGSAHVRVADNSPTAYSITWPVDTKLETLADDWTAMVWRDDGLGGGYKLYVETSAGDYYLDGVSTTQETWFAVTGNNLTLQGRDSGVSQVDFDGLRFYPFVWPTSWLAGNYTFQNSAGYAKAGVIGMGGDLVTNSASLMLARGMSAELEFTQGAMSGTWYNNLGVVRFTLGEVFST